MLTSQKHVFWQALFVTIIIFGVGIFVGVILENWRVSEVNTLAQQSEVHLLDIKLQNQIYTEEEFDCDIATAENINFADRIYEEAEILGRYEQASRLTQDIVVQHQKYDILRATLILNSEKIKQKCNASYHEIVYFYRYNELTTDEKSKQGVFSKMLTEIKEEKGSEVLLIPLAGDNDLSSITLLLDKYGLSQQDLPIIIIDHDIKITEIESVDDILKHLE